MGLDNVISYSNNPDNDEHLSEDTILMIHNNVQGLPYLGINMNLKYHLENKYIIIPGKAHTKTIELITGFHLYCDHSPESLGKIADSLEKYIDDNEECLDTITELIDASYENMIAIEMYARTLTRGKTSGFNPEEVKALCQLFRIMSQNNLWLNASY